MATSVGYKAVKLTAEGQDWQAWDKAGRLYGLAELEIPADAVVVVPLKKEEHNDTAFVGKRRADRALVKNITALDGSPLDGSFIGRSDHAWEFVYTKGATVQLSQKERDGYDTMKEFNDPAHPCCTGIHYFETQEGARKLASFWQNIHDIA